MKRIIAVITLFAAVSFAAYGAVPRSEGPPKWPKNTSTVRGL